MNRLLTISLLLISLSALGQVDSVKTDKKKLDSLIRLIKTDKKKLKISENHLTLKPTIGKSGLTSINIIQGDNVIYIFNIDPKTYKIVSEDDLR